MKKELLLLRHAKSDWDYTFNDFDRPLKHRGKRNAQTIGLWLHMQQIIPDFILSSPAKRAISTTKKVCKAMNLNTKMIHQDERIYESDVITLKQILAECSKDSQSVLLVGHNPGLEQLLLDLVDNKVEIPEDGKLLATATLARLQMPADWNNLAKGCAKVISVTRAASLPIAYP